MGLQERLDDESDPNGSDTCMGSMPSLSSPLSRMSFSDLSAADRFAELRDTEAAYVSDLRTMVSVYARPAQKLAILSREEREAIFCNTEQLLMCNEALLDALRKEGEPEEVWAAAFLSIAPFFKIYASYANNYYTALQTAQDARERSDGFREFLTSQSARAESKNLPLESFLIKPVQRLTKYPLFFTDFLRVVPPDHPARPKLLKAHELVLSVSRSVNSSQQIDGPAIFQALLTSLGPRYLVLLAPHRRLRLKFLCAVSTPARPLACIGFLLSDVLLLCQRRTAGALRCWMLVALRDILVGDEALDGDRQYALIAQPLTDHFLPLRLTPFARSSAPSISHLAHADDPSDSKHLQRERSAGARAAPGGALQSSPRRTSTSSAGMVDEECFRLEFESQEALDVVQQALQSCFASLERADAEARRPNRRLRSNQLEAGVLELVTDLAEERAREDAGFRRHAEKSAKTPSSMLRMMSSRGSNAGVTPSAKEAADAIERQSSSSEPRSDSGKRRSLTSRLRSSGDGSASGAEGGHGAPSLSPRASFAELFSPEQPSPRRSMAGMPTLRTSMSGSCSSAVTQATLLAAGRQQQAVADPINHFFGDQTWEKFE